MEAENLYLETGAGLNGEESQMFGKPCFKINGKAFIAFYENSLVCKLTGNAHTEALSLNNAHLFDPSGKGRPMKEWVQIPYEHHEQWQGFAGSAKAYVASMSG